MIQLNEVPKISLAAARVNANLKQEELAKLLGVNKSTIVSWEKGKTEPNANQLKKISAISRIPMDFIFIPEES